jgi:membrane dipeptidase
MIVDSHLDLAENVTLFGRDLSLPALERRLLEKRVGVIGPSGQATVGLPDMQRGGVAVVCATVTPGFLVADVGADFEPQSALYSTPEEAEAQALKQIALYRGWEKRGLVRLLGSAADLDDHLARWQYDRLPGLVLLMEGADPIVHVEDLPRWWDLGLRMIGLTFGDTRYGVGVASGRAAVRPGGLTSDGLAMLDRMAELGFIWDISHLAEGGVWQGLATGFQHVCASHATARALLPTDRHLSDEVLRAVAARGGVIGLPLYNAFLDTRWRQDKTTPVTLADQARRHLDYLAGVIGWEHVGIGSDLDGGFGMEQSPAEIDTIADLHKIGEIVPTEAREAVLSANWLRFLRAALP